MIPLCWSCTNCRATGVVDLPSGYFALSLLFESIRGAHANVARECLYDANRIQVAMTVMTLKKPVGREESGGGR